MTAVCFSYFACMCTSILNVLFNNVYCFQIAFLNFSLRSLISNELPSTHNCSFLLILQVIFCQLANLSIETANRSATPLL